MKKLLKFLTIIVVFTAMTVTAHAAINPGPNASFEAVKAAIEASLDGETLTIVGGAVTEGNSYGWLNPWGFHNSTFSTTGHKNIETPTKICSTCGMDGISKVTSPHGFFSMHSNLYTDGSGVAIYSFSRKTLEIRPATLTSYGTCNKSYTDYDLKDNSAGCHRVRVGKYVENCNTPMYQGGMSIDERSTVSYTISKIICEGVTFNASPFVYNSKFLGITSFEFRNCTFNVAVSSTWYSNGLDDVNAVFDNCTFNQATYFRNRTASINNCRFNNKVTFENCNCVINNPATAFANATIEVLGTNYISGPNTTAQEFATPGSRLVITGSGAIHFNGYLDLTNKTVTCSGSPQIYTYGQNKLDKMRLSGSGTLTLGTLQSGVLLSATAANVQGVNLVIVGTYSDINLTSWNSNANLTLHCSITSQDDGEHKSGWINLKSCTFQQLNGGTLNDIYIEGGSYTGAPAAACSSVFVRTGVFYNRANTSSSIIIDSDLSEINPSKDGDTNIQSVKLLNPPVIIDWADFPGIPRCSPY